MDKKILLTLHKKNTRFYYIFYLNVILEIIYYAKIKYEAFKNNILNNKAIKIVNFIIILLKNILIKM